MAVLYGDLDQARSYAEEALRLSRIAGLQYVSTVMSYNLGLIAAHHKDEVEARRQDVDGRGGSVYVPV